MNYGRADENDQFGRRSPTYPLYKVIRNPYSRAVEGIKNNKLGIIVHAILVQAIIVQAISSNKLSILNNKLSKLSNKLISSSNKLSIIVQAILVQAILVQRYSCAPNILYYINHSTYQVIYLYISVWLRLVAF